MNTRAQDATRCPTCGGDLMTITLQIGNDEAGYRICPPCEHTWWERDGAAVSRDQVLSRLTAR